jgi:hypothetical protein
MYLAQNRHPERVLKNTLASAFHVAWAPEPMRVDWNAKCHLRVIALTKPQAQN